MSDAQTILNQSLLNAVETNNMALVEQLLAKGADINAKNWIGQTPLHYAILLTGCSDPSHCCGVELLVKYGANVNIQDNNGDTPLHFALKNYTYAQAINAMFILNGDCDVSIKNKQGETVFDLLEKCKQEKRINAEDYSKIMQRLLEKQKKTAPHQINLMAQQREGRSRE